MDTTGSEDERQSAQAKSKLDALSRDDLIRFAKKQLDHKRRAESEAKKYKELLEAKESAVKKPIEDAYHSRELELGSGNNDVNCVSSSGEPGFIENISTLSSDSLVELNTMLAAQISQLKKERACIDEELSTALHMNNVLRSQLDNAVKEAVALREQRTAADVVSLELKDYETKLVELKKSLKDAQNDLVASNTEKKRLTEELSMQILSNNRMKTECSTLQQELEDVKSRLHDEKRCVQELNSEVDKLKDDLYHLSFVLNKEKANFERKITHYEELMAHWEKTCKLKTAEMTEIVEENRMLKSRCENLESDYSSYKSRARYVLEQQTKVVEGHATTSREDVEDLGDLAAGLRNDLRALQSVHRSVIDDTKMFRDQCMKANRNDAILASELQRRLTEINEDLLNCNMMLELRTSECHQHQLQIKELEEQLENQRKTKEEAVAVLQEKIATKTIIEAELTADLEKEKTRCEEAARLLSDAQKSSSDVSLTPHSHLQQSVDLPMEHYSTSRHSHMMSTSTITDDEEKHEPSLEDVLFGEEFADPDYVPTQKIFSLMNENNRLLKQLNHIRTLLRDAEATNATLIDQSILLKEEIRRMERNEERLGHFGNSEYLKNVIIKFLSPERVAGERLQLVPILTTMLRLSRDESQLLSRAAIQDDTTRSESDNSWGSYLRWAHTN